MSQYLARITAVLALVFTFGGPLFSQAQAQSPGDLIEVLSSDPSFSTFVNAIEAAGLTQTLKGEGPFTVFAPTNAAFASLPGGTLNALLAPENKELLAQVVMYHIVPGDITAADLIAAGTVASVSGPDLTIWTQGNDVFVNQAKIITADVPASNGMIHVIDSVLIPPSD